VPSLPGQRLKGGKSKVLPLRWSLGSKDRRKPDTVSPPAEDAAPVELVQYLESGRRPRCTKDSIITLMNESQRNTKKTPEPRAFRSSVGGGMSCVGKMEDDPPLPQVPEGQRHPSDKTGSLRRRKESQPREETVNIGSSCSSNTLTRRKDGQRHSSSKASQDTETRRSSSAGVHPSHSPASLQDGTLRRQKGDRIHKDQHTAREEKPKKEDASKSHDGLFAFLKGNFLKKEKELVKSKDGESAEGGKSNGSASLHRNGMTTAPSRSLATDRPSHGPLQRTRHSTTSLGRKKPVPESSF
uniref:Uncharacterized protein n=1 Tax=Nothobranchius furzeri TaxID=105023 RepID=A0A8C6MCT4_NOTFU